MKKFKSYEDLLDYLKKIPGKKDSSKELTKHFVAARFGIKDDVKFDAGYSDRKNDGGIDFFFKEDEKNFHIVQTKYIKNEPQISIDMIEPELKKIDNTIFNQNTNKKAEEFVKSLKSGVRNSDVTLNVYWLTTGILSDETIQSASETLCQFVNDKSWNIRVNFNPFSKRELVTLFQDYCHGYSSYTGLKELPVIDGCIFDKTDNTSKISTFVCNVKVIDLLEWIPTKSRLKQYLQKNVRDYAGDSKMNRLIRSSFVSDPNWFWYKHNGIIIFANDARLNDCKTKLVLRDPQIVNGGQTLVALYSAYDSNRKKFESSKAECLVRVYCTGRETQYQRVIDIITALNSQTAIKAWDLRSADSRQVVLEDLFQEYGFTYYRKSGKENKSSSISITMKNLAIYYRVCSKQAPYLGVSSNVEEIFKEDSSYNSVFPEDLINSKTSIGDEDPDHIIYDYILVWVLADLTNKIKGELKEKHAMSLHQYIKFFVLVDMYDKFKKWKKKDRLSKSLVSFIKSSEFSSGLRQYAIDVSNKTVGIKPRRVEAKSFFKRKESYKTFSESMNNTRAFNKAIKSAYRDFKK